MEKELRIVISLFLIFLIYGIASLIQDAAFVTPIFVTPFILVFVSLYFALSNRKESKSYILWVYLLAMLSLAATDGFIIGLIRKTQSESIVTSLDSDWVALLTFFLFFGILFYLVYFFFSRTKNKLAAISILVPLFATFVLFFTDLYIFQELGVQLFYLSFFYFGQRDSEAKNKSLRIISYQFLLIALLQAFEYFI